MHSQKKKNNQHKQTIKKRRANTNVNNKFININYLLILITNHLYSHSVMVMGIVASKILLLCRLLFIYIVYKFKSESLWCRDRAPDSLATQVYNMQFIIHQKTAYKYNCCRRRCRQHTATSSSSSCHMCTKQTHTGKNSVVHMAEYTLLHCIYYIALYTYTHLISISFIRMVYAQHV